MTTEQSDKPPPASGYDCREGLTDPAVGSTLSQVRHQTAELLSSLAHPPQALHVHAGDVAIDIEWPEAAEVAVHAEIPPEGDTTPSDAEPALVLTAQAVGVFYRAPEPGAEPFVTEGDTVSVGQQVAIIEAMKLMIPVEAELAGVILQVLKKDLEPVEYGEPLFTLATVENK